MLLNSSCRATAVPVEVSVTLSGMGNPKTSALESSSSSIQPSALGTQPQPQQPEVSNLSKQRSTSSSRASFEASIDALVDVQLAKLVEVICYTNKLSAKEVL